MKRLLKGMVQEKRVLVWPSDERCAPARSAPLAIESEIESACYASWDVTLEPQAHPLRTRSAPCPQQNR